MKRSMIGLVARKELVETLRDKRTLLAMVGVPMLLYPLLIIISLQVATVQKARTEERLSKIGFSQSVPDEVRQWVSDIDKVEGVASEEGTPDLSSGEIDALVVVESGDWSKLADGDTLPIRIEYDGTEVNSQKARTRLRDALVDKEKEILATRVAERNLSEGFADPFVITLENMAPTRKKIGSTMGGILPMLMIIMLGLGAFYPAVDLTAGEKERGTYETLLSTPISRFEILCGKFITVVCVSLFTGVLNLASMALTLYFKISQSSAQMGGGDGAFNLSDLSLSLGDMGKMLLVLVPLAFFICSVMMAIAIFARDFKEAQNYITPFLIVIIAPAMFGMLPGVELDSSTVFVPIANVALLLKTMMMGEAGVDQYVIVLFATCVYACLALNLAVLMFNNEQVVLSEEKGLPLTLSRKDFVASKAPTFGTAMFYFAIQALLLFHIGTWLQAWDLYPGLLISQYGLMLAVTLFFLWYTKIDIRQTLNLKPAQPMIWPGVIVMAFGSYGLIVSYMGLQDIFLPMPQEFKDHMEAFVAGKELPLWAMICIIAVTPAICEEVVFRGVILSGVRTQLSARASIILVGVLFGAFHISVYRVIPTGMLGVVLTYLALRSGSIYPAMLFHFMINSASVLLSSKEFGAWIDSGSAPMWLASLKNMEEQALPLWITGMSLGLFLIGIGMIEKTVRRQPSRALS